MKKLLFPLILLAMTVHSGIANSSGNADGNAYSIKVTVSDGSAFDDCMRFDGAGTMTLDGLPGYTLAYGYDSLGSIPSAWQSTLRPLDIFGLSFHGSATFNAKGFPIIRGNAINDENTTFKFTTYTKRQVCAATGAAGMSSNQQHWGSASGK